MVAAFTNRKQKGQHIHICYICTGTTFTMGISYIL